MPSQDEEPPRERSSFSTSGPPELSHHAPLADDLRVPWGWLDVLMFVVLGVVGSFVIMWAFAQIAVVAFRLPPGDVFGSTITTAKSLVALVSQAAVDLGLVLFLYALVVTKTSAPFWPSIGWREMRAGMRTVRELAPQFLAGGALLALAVSFASTFFKTKELPIEEYLKAPVSMVLFGILGVTVAPLVEETIFRGFLYPVIARTSGVAAGIVITGTLFGLMHWAQLGGAVGQVSLLIFVGIVLTSVRAWTGTVAASFFVHLGYNGLQLAGYLVYMIGRGHH
jgi:membrane protease YdiL (CAAX protease family)